MSDLQQELTELLNKYAQENTSNSPDFILARYLLRSLFAFNDATSARDQWYGVHLEPGNKYFK